MDRDKTVGELGFGGNAGHFSVLLGVSRLCALLIRFQYLTGL
jgi:hypothetical protein